MDLAAYRDFIASKGSAQASRGFDMRGSWPSLFEHQRRALAFACETGRAAAFLSTGLGKSRISAAFAHEAIEQTGKPALILTPLAVARQMQRECEAVGVESRVIREDADIWPGVNIANYERLPKLDASRFGAVVTDEGSILKSFTGSTKRMLVETFKVTPYRLSSTATPAPNDHMEIGQQSEFLGVMPGPEMLSRWFISDQTTMGGYRLKGHAVAPFWEWVASWSRAATLPSDLGGDDTGFILPPLKYEMHELRVDLTEGAQGALFREVDQSATAIHAEKRRTMADRVARAAEIANRETGPVLVWCETNDESAALAKAIPDAVEVHGSQSIEAKEDGLDGFATGKYRVLVSKPKLAGFGLNYQHCATVIFASISHSYEQHFQAIRRVWRFGQKLPVTAHVVLAETEQMIWANVRRKSEDHEAMRVNMAAAMTRAQKSSQLRVAYTRAPQIELPAFMRGDHAA